MNVPNHETSTTAAACLVRLPVIHHARFTLLLDRLLPHRTDPSLFTPNISPNRWTTLIQSETKLLALKVCLDGVLGVLVMEVLRSVDINTCLGEKLRSVNGC
ncbi:unnamed protein product [Cuscuta epithymum]|uniref:Uncharacterized protein n=1 Tax=Cuscuta epithymum TaxID=186058 RepID=A0AAV0FJX6_9ASTE|nr:unnamed protein product [Cuscuta epithymum]